jgi:hypothetical protein
MVNLKERDHLEYLDVDGKIIIKYNLSVDWIRLAQDSNHVSGCCDHGNELSGSIKCGEFLCWVIRKGSAP